MKNYVVVGFHIDNVKQDYAFAFKFVKYGMKSFLSNEEKEWVLKHVFSTSFELEINDNDFFRHIIEKYEKIFSQGNIKNVFDLNLDNLLTRVFFYFRVQNNSDDDIINLHNFFLGNKLCLESCCLGIIANEVEMHFKISDFLFYEVYLSKKNKAIKIVNKQSVGKYKYQIEIINDKPVNVFLLNKSFGIYVPISIHKKGVNSSGTFFPQMIIDQNLYFTFSKNAENFCKRVLSYEVDKKYAMYSNDLLLNIALLNNIALPTQQQDIEMALNKRFDFLNENIVESILLLYCIRCVKLILNNRSSIVRQNLSNEINDFLSDEGRNSTILSICLFLSYLSRLENNKRNDVKWIDILTDAQDYASGVLQLIENVIKHVPSGEGIFCFRLHKCLADNTNSANVRLNTRYSIVDTKTEGFFIEIIVSDFNEKFDIPQKFISNIRRNLSFPENEREYYVSNNILDSVSNFKLWDLFNYSNNQITEQTWKAFYSHPQNLIAHYGLLVFEHLIKFAQGSFHVFSSNDFSIGKSQCYCSENSHIGNKFIHIPGTQYEILLPIGVNRTPLETGLVQEIKTNCYNPTSDIISIEEGKYKVLLNEQFENFYKSSDHSLRPFWKSKTANDISENIIKTIHQEIRKVSITSPNTFLFTFNVEKITNMTASEVFVKAFIKVVFNKEISEVKRFAFFNASEVFLTTFIRFFSILYMKSGQSSQMTDRFIYLCADSMSDEVYFIGNSIHNSFAITKRAVFDETGKVTHGLQVLRREAEKSCEKQTESVISYQDIQQIIQPFFKQHVLKVLKSDIQHEEFGCCMRETHMRIGSKIHINGNYYEAALLFGLSGYVSHFAMYIAENIIKSIDKLNTSKCKKLIIIGYETYSESLAIRVKETLQNQIKSKKLKMVIDYVIYNESRSDNKFYRWSSVKPNKDTKFILIVPVGSTLTTHDKVVADLLRTDLTGANHAKPERESLFAHYVIVLVRDKQKNKDSVSDRSEREKLFWSSIMEASDSNKSIIIEYSKEMSDIGAENIIQCYLYVESNWYLPNVCPYCFPKQGNLIAEKPLVLANRSSVVPMTKIGKIEEINVPIEKNIIELLESKITDDIDNMRSLCDALCYGHIVRDGDNHFEYYFQTEKIMESTMKNNKNLLHKRLRSWKQNLKKQQSPEVIYFDYIVAPLHNTNANFVHWVSQNLQTKQIIWIDTKKDFRDNISAKFSNLNSVYHNSCNQNGNVEMRFHYVDDTINSGVAFFRAKSLISSIFTDIKNNKDNVKVKVFHSVFLLLSRCSFNTKKNYVDDPNLNFHSIYDLNISYMRSYSDACVPCKNEYNLSVKLPNYSSTFDIARLSLKKARRFKKIDAGKIDKPFQMLPLGDQKDIGHNSEQVEVLRFRYYYRMIATHRLNNMLNKLKKHMNNASIVEEYIWAQIEEILLLNNDDLRLDLIISVLKVISRPFLSFRKSVNEAAMKIIITIAEYVILKNDLHILKCCKEIDRFKEVINTNENKFILVRVLFSCLTNLRSTFLLRSNTIKEILELCEEFDNNEKHPKELIASYIFSVKSLMCLSENSSISIWIKNLIQEGEIVEKSTVENLDSHKVDAIKLNDYKYGIDIRNMLMVENIMPIRDALNQCYKLWEQNGFKDSNIDESISEALGHYYCRTYCEFVNIDKKQDIKKFSNHCVNVFSPMLHLYHHLSEYGGTIKDGSKEMVYYNKFLTLVNEILETSEAELLTKIPPNTADVLKDKEIFSLYSTVPVQQNSSEKTDLIKFLEKISSATKNSSYVCVGETLFFEKWEQNCRIGSIKIINTSSSIMKNESYEYYLVFKWNNYIEDMEIISKVRNLLSMRSMLMERIVNDFDNHIRNEFIMLRDKVNCLNTDRAGSHSPFRELREVFVKTNKIIEKTICNSENDGIYLSYLKLIADSVISKLYVHSIAKTFPEGFHPEKYKIRDENNSDKIPLTYYKKIFDILRTNGKVVTSYGATKISGRNSSIDDKLANCRIISPNNCGYLWCCAFIALYYNAINHGYATQNNNKEYEVDVNIFCDNEYVYFCNRAKYNANNESASENQLNGVTLDALRYYFDNYYEEGLFRCSVDLKDGVKYYTVQIPMGHKLIERRENNA